jgi:hypothetical protein
MEKDALPFPCSNSFYKYFNHIKYKLHNEDTEVWGALVGTKKHRRGCGKSVRAQEIAYIVNDGKVDITKIAFTKDEFIRAVLSSRKECIVADEGVSIFFSRAAMTKEGRLMAELADQIRQRNLCIIICIPNPLNLDTTILDALAFIGVVTETRRPTSQGGPPVLHKGDLFMFPNLPNKDYVQSYLNYLKIKKSQPLIKLKRPIPVFREPGHPYGPNYKPAFYAVEEKEYRKKKESILKKYEGLQKVRKPMNRNIDYGEMQKLLKANVKHKEIAQLLNCSKERVDKYSIAMNKGIVAGRKKPIVLKKKH